MTDKRYRVGIWVTVLYLFALAIYTFLEREAVMKLEPNTLGDALAGAASPLAFLWLVLGYLQQGEELRQNTEALRLQASELRASVEQQTKIAATSQLQFETYKDQLKQADEALNPRFVLRMHKADQDGANKHFKIEVRNVGAKCSALTAVLDWGEGFNQSEHFGDVDSFGTFNFNVTWPHFPLEERKLSFILQYYVLRGGIRSTFVPLRFYWVTSGLMFLEKLTDEHMLGPSP
jgi:hypothetical protein